MGRERPGEHRQEAEADPLPGDRLAGGLQARRAEGQADLPEHDAGGAWPRAGIGGPRTQPWLGGRRCLRAGGRHDGRGTLDGSAEGVERLAAQPLHHIGPRRRRPAHPDGPVEQGERRRPEGGAMLGEQVAGGVDDLQVDQVLVPAGALEQRLQIGGRARLHDRLAAHGQEASQRQAALSKRLEHQIGHGGALGQHQQCRERRQDRAGPQGLRMARPEGAARRAVRGPGWRSPRHHRSPSPAVTEVIPALDSRRPPGSLRRGINIGSRPGKGHARRNSTPEATRPVPAGHGSG